MEFSADELEKIADLRSHGVSAGQICIIIGCEEGDLTKVLEDKEFIRHEAIKDAERLEERNLLDRGWDGLEAQSLSVLNKYMNRNADPEFALKVAAVANKATRRKLVAMDTIDPSRHGAVTIINMPMSVVNQINGQVNENIRHALVVKEGKIENKLQMNKVPELLGITAEQKSAAEFAAGMESLIPIDEVENNLKKVGLPAGVVHKAIGPTELMKALASKSQPGRF